MIEGWMIIGLFIVALPAIYFVAKANVDRHFVIRDEMVNRGLQYCLAELAICRSDERECALKAAIQELQKSKYEQSN